MKDSNSLKKCSSCKFLPDCLVQGTVKSQLCDKYEPMNLDELVERDRRINKLAVGSCRFCGSEHTYTCNNPLELIINDPAIGYCLDCATYWCLECGCVIKVIKKDIKCEHYEICFKCSQKRGYMGADEFIYKVCPVCEHYNQECSPEDLFDCAKKQEYMCPHFGAVWKCAIIQDWLLNTQSRNSSDLWSSS